jgi:hypothetical protein
MGDWYFDFVKSAKAKQKKKINLREYQSRLQKKELGIFAADPGTVEEVPEVSRTRRKHVGDILRERSTDIDAPRTHVYSVPDDVKVEDITKPCIRPPGDLFRGAQYKETILSQEAADKKTNDRLIKERSDLRGRKIEYVRPENLRDDTNYASLYRSNTYITVYEEAQKEGTTMHEICTRKGLEYRFLLM